VNLLSIAWVAIGGAIGSVARFCPVYSDLRLSGSLFPVGTFAVNLAGCIAFGAIVGAAEAALRSHSNARAFLLVGVLGGFTTFSSYAFESVALVQDGQYGGGPLNLIGQVVAGLLGFWVAYVIAH